MADQPTARVQSPAKSPPGAVRRAADDHEREQERRDREAADRQLETVPDEQLYEVLTERPTGHRTVHRLRAADRQAAEAAVTDALEPVVDAGVRVVGAAVAGAGLGSGG